MTSSESVSASSEVDNSSGMVHKIARLYADHLLSDVHIVVNEESNVYPCHRIILSASSPVFQIMLMSPSWSESQTHLIRLQEAPSCAAVFESFLKYLYTGRVMLDFTNVIPLVSLADKYDVDDLIKIGLSFMSRNVSNACKKHQVVSWFQFAHAANHHQVAEACRDFIKWNFETVAESVDFVNMELETLVYFLRCNDLVVTEETQLLQHVEKWIEQKRKQLEEELNKESSSNKEGNTISNDVASMVSMYVESLLPFIRFPMMTPTQLVELLLSPLSQSHITLLVDQIRTALCFHKDQLEDFRRQNMDENTLRLFTPRLYTAERYSASLNIESVQSLNSYHCRSLVFHAEKSSQDAMGTDQVEWVVNVYPKGVWFQRCLTVYKPSGLEVPERVIRTVRVSVVCREQEEQRAHIGVLVKGKQDGFEHIRRAVVKNFNFGPDQEVLNLDDIIDFDALNDRSQSSPFLCGESGEALRLHLVITPLSKYSSFQAT